MEETFRANQSKQEGKLFSLGAREGRDNQPGIKTSQEQVYPIGYGGPRLFYSGSCLGPASSMETDQRNK